MRVGCLIALLFLAALSSPAESPPSTWEPKHTTLANHYLQLLIAEPEYGDIVELLWSLYQKHGETELLLTNVAAQAEQSDHPSPKLIHAHLIRQSGDLEAAAELYRDLLTQHSDHPIALRALADIASIQGNAAEHLTTLRKLASLLPPSSDHYLETLIQLGHAEVEAGQLTAASSAWTKALNHNPGDPELRRRLARAMLSAGLTRPALEQFTTLSKSEDPQTQVAALEELARIQEHLGRVDAAADTLREGIGLTHVHDWRHEKFFTSLIRLHERAGTLDELEKNLAAATASPSEATLLPLIRLHQWTVDLEALEATLRQLVAIPGTPVAYRRELADVLLANNQEEEAGELIDALLAEAPTKQPELVLHRCEIDFRLGNRDQALARLRDLLGEQPPQALARQVLAFAQENYLSDLVREILETFHRSNPSDGEAVFALSDYFFDQNAREEAMGILEQHLTSVPEDSAEYLARLGEIANRLLSANELDEALKFASEAAAHQRAGRAEFLALAEIRSHLGDVEGAKKNFERAWLASTDHETRTDIDERLLSLLENHGLKDTVEEVDSPMAPQPSIESNPFAAITENDKPPAPVSVGAASIAFAKAQSEKATASPTPPLLFRAAWWAVQTNQNATAYDHLRKILYDDDFKRAEASLEAELLLLALTAQDQNEALRVRQLKRLTETDPEAAHTYQRQLAAIDFDRGFRERAITTLYSLVKTEPSDLHSLELLASLLFQDGRTNEILPLWETAFENAPAPLLPEITERYARILVETDEMDKAASVLIECLRQTSDPSRREDFLQHQKSLVDLANRSPMNDQQKHPLARTLIPHYRKLAAETPLDPFYPSVLADLHTLTREPEAAFKAMREAHYLSPDNETTLPDLRDAAIAINDRAAAIYYQRQLLFSPNTDAELSEWKRLIDLLEGTLRIDEADEIRGQLARRFSQNPEPLLDLATSYEAAAQTTEAVQIREQLTQLLPKNIPLRMRLALGYLEIEDSEAAIPMLQSIIEDSPTLPLDAPLYYPITEERWDAIPRLQNIADALLGSTVLSQERADAWDQILNERFPEFQRIPSEPALLRLNAIHHLGRLVSPDSPEGQALLDSTISHPTESLWARSAMRMTLDLPEPEDDWISFCQAITLLRCDTPPQGDAAILETAILVLIELEDWTPSPQTLNILTDSTELSGTDLWRISQHFARAKHYTEALAVGEKAVERGNLLAPVYAYHLTRQARTLKDSTTERALFRRALDQSLESVRNTGQNLFYDSFLHLYRRLPNERERSQLVQETLTKTRAITIPHERLMRLTYIAAVKGDTNTARETLGSFYDHAVSRGVPGNYAVTNLFASRRRGSTPVSEQLFGHAGLLKRHQFAPLANDLLSSSANLFDSQLLPDEDNRYRSDALNHLWIVDQIRHLTPAETERYLLEATDGLEDPFGAVELASVLKSNGYHRACASIYRNLLNRVPANPDYGNEYVDACIAARDFDAGLAYVEEFHASHPDRRPQSLVPDGIRNAEANFLRFAYDSETLAERAFARTPSEESRELMRYPKEYFFLRELATLASATGDTELELKALRRIYEWRPQFKDTSAPLAEAMLRQGDAAGVIELFSAPDAITHRIPEHTGLLAEAYAQSGNWEAFTETLTQLIDDGDIPRTISAAALYLEAGRPENARNALLLASRRSSSAADQLALLPALLRAIAASDSPNLTGIDSILRRAATDEAADPNVLTELATTLFDHRQVLAPLITPLLTENANTHPKTFYGLMASALDNWDLAQRHLFNPDAPALRSPLLVAAEQWLRMDKPRNALRVWDHLLANTKTTSALPPLHVSIHAALGDDESIEKIFAEAQHYFFPGAPYGIELPVALAKVGRANLADELFASYDDQLTRARATSHEFSTAYAEFLIAQDQISAADSLLRRDAVILNENLPRLLVSLFAKQNRLPALEKEIHRYHLTSGMITETLHLANRK